MRRHGNVHRPRRVLRKRRGIASYRRFLQLLPLAAQRPPRLVPPHNLWMRLQISPPPVPLPQRQETRQGRQLQAEKRIELEKIYTKGRPSMVVKLIRE